MKIYAPLDCGSASVNGHTFEVVDGTIDCNADEFEELKAHGFSDTPPAKPLTPTEQKKEDKVAALKAKELAEAVAARDAARKDLFDTEGLGDDEATATAKSLLDEAEELVKALS